MSDLWYIPGATRPDGTQQDYYRADAPFILNGNQFPGNYPKTDVPGAQQVATVGEWGSDPEYWINGETLVGATRALTKTARPLADCQAVAISRVKRTAASMLAPSDWKVIRWQEDPTKTLDQITADYRSAIRVASNAHEAVINAVTTVEELAALTFIWPEL